MYEPFYGLTDRPFEPGVDPRYLLLTDGQLEVLDHLKYRIARGRGVTLLTGAAGTGKTTLLRTVERSDPNLAQKLVYLDNPTLTRAEFLQAVALGFELTPRARVSKVRLLQELAESLDALHRHATPCALIVDEAQQLPDALLEELRLLSNLGAEASTPFSILLAGQPELSARLNEPRLEHLKQRIASRCRLSPLSVAETGAYIAGRLAIAGGDPTSIFSADGVGAVFEHSRGIPRLIGTICDAALLAGYGAGARPVTGRLVHETCAELDLGSREQAAVAPPAPAVPGAIQPLGVGA
jgi:general secretion pathway protein A